jgi:hypothetical protein
MGDLLKDLLTIAALLFHLHVVTLFYSIVGTPVSICQHPVTTSPPSTLAATTGVNTP